MVIRVSFTYVTPDWLRFQPYPIEEEIKSLMFSGNICILSAEATPTWANEKANFFKWKRLRLLWPPISQTLQNHELSLKIKFSGILIYKRLILSRPEDQTLFDLKIAYFAESLNCKVKVKVGKKLNKYLDLGWELKKLWEDEGDTDINLRWSS